ncbi:Ig-like domain-containing protein [Methanobrevibacter sp.]
MKFKKMMLVALLLLAILTIGAVSASEDEDMLAVNDDAGDTEIQVPAADEILTDNSTFIMEDEDDDEGDDDPYRVELMEEFDITDREQEIIRIYCPEETEGYFIINTLDDDWRELYTYYHEISENDWGNVIGVTPDDLDINEPGGYIIDIYLSDDPENYHDDNLIFEAWRGIEAIDYTQFRYISLDTFAPNALSMGNIFAVYCPDGSSGTVTVKIGKEDEEQFTFQKQISDKDDENKLYWTLEELDIFQDGKYLFTVYDNSGDELASDEIGVTSPIGIEPSSYIDSAIHGDLVIIEMPSIFEDANITLIINGEDNFTMSLSEFSDETGDSPYWEYAHESGWIAEDYKWYHINNYHLDYNFEEDNYIITVILTINCQNGVNIFNREEEVRMINRNVVRNGDYSIEIFGDNGYNFEDWTPIIVIEAPEDCEGTLSIEVEDNEWSLEGPLDEIGNYDEEYWIFPELFNELGSGDYEITVTYLENGEPLIETSAFIRFFGDEDDEEDEPIEDIEFHFIGGDDDEEDFEFEIGNNTLIGELLVPASEEFDATEITINSLRNGEFYDCVLIDRTDSLDRGEFIEEDNLYRYVISMDLTRLNDKDLLEITVDCFFIDSHDLHRCDIWTYAIEIAEDTAIFHWYDEGVQSYVFQGNITVGDFNNPNLMGPHPEGRFIELSIPGSYEGSIVVSDDETTFIDKSLEELNSTYSYNNLGNVYQISLEDYDLMSLPENRTLTISLNYGEDSLTFKRIRLGDYLYKIVTPEDIAKLYDISISDEISGENGDVVSFVATDRANRQSIWIDANSGEFYVYVNGEKIEGLGDLILDNWIYDSGVLDADEEGLREWGIGISSGIDVKNFENLPEEERASQLRDAFEDVFSDEITLYYLTSFDYGCPYLFLSLDDLGITESGTYNVKITHMPYPPEPYDPEPGEPIWLPDNNYIVENLVLEKNVTVNLKMDPFISISAEDVNYGEDAVIVANLASGINGNVHFTVNGVTGKASIVNGIATYTVSGLSVGSYEVSARFNGNKNYDAQTITTSFNVEKLSPFISVSPVTVKYGQDATFTVNLASDVPGNVRFALNGNDGEKAKITNGVATYTYSGLKYGSYNVDISYAGNYKYAADTISTTLKVNKNYPIVSVVANDIGYNENATVTVNLAQNVPGNVHVTVGNVTQKVQITDSVATATFTGLKRGTYDVTASYAGNVNYVAQTKTASFTVTKGTPIISVDGPDVGYGEDAVITVNLGRDVPGNVRVTINGATQKSSISNGAATVTFSGLLRGTYSVLVSYAGNVNYNAQNFTTTLNVVKGTPVTDISVKNTNVGDTAVITVTMANNVNGNVRITVNGATHKVQIVNGVAVLNVTGLKAGTYDVSAVYAGNANFNAQTLTGNFTVNKISPGIKISKSTVDGSPKITVKIAPDAPGNVRITLNGVTYKLPISGGEASIILPELGSGRYVVEATYAGNYKYLAETKTQEIAVR